MMNDLEMKAFNEFVRYGESKFMNTMDDTLGGYLVPSQLHNRLIESALQISPIRQLSRVVKISGGNLIVPTTLSDFVVSFLGEGDTISASDSQFGDVVIPANKLMAEVRFTREILEDSAFSIRDEILQRAIGKFAEAEGNAFINGTGIGQPQGLLTASGALGVNSGHATQLKADAFFDMLGEFKYRNPVFVMNVKTFAAARMLKSGTGNYLLQSGLNGPKFLGVADMNLNVAGFIAGVPVVISPDMPDVGAGNKPVALLDAGQTYMVVDSAFDILRDDYTYSSSDIIRFVLAKRVGGAVVLPDSLVVMTISA